MLRDHRTPAAAGPDPDESPAIRCGVASVGPPVAPVGGRNGPQPPRGARAARAPGRPRGSRRARSIAFRRSLVSPCVAVGPPQPHRSRFERLPPDVAESRSPLRPADRFHRRRPSAGSSFERNSRRRSAVRCGRDPRPPRSRAGPAGRTGRTGEGSPRPGRGGPPTGGRHPASTGRATTSHPPPPRSASLRRRAAAQRPTESLAPATRARNARGLETFFSGLPPLPFPRDPGPCPGRPWSLAPPAARSAGGSSETRSRHGHGAKDIATSPTHQPHAPAVRRTPALAPRPVASPGPSSLEPAGSADLVPVSWRARRPSSGRGSALTDPQPIRTTRRAHPREPSRSPSRASARYRPRPRTSDRSAGTAPRRRALAEEGREAVRERHAPCHTSPPSPPVPSSERGSPAAVAPAPSIRGARRPKGGSARSRRISARTGPRSARRSGWRGSPVGRPVPVPLGRDTRPVPRYRQRPRSGGSRLPFRVGTRPVPRLVATGFGLRAVRSSACRTRSCRRSCAPSGSCRPTLPRPVGRPRAARAAPWAPRRSGSPGRAWPPFPDRASR